MGSTCCKLQSKSSYWSWKFPVRREYGQIWRTVWRMANKGRGDTEALQRLRIMTEAVNNWVNIAKKCYEEALRCLWIKFIDPRTTQATYAQAVVWLLLAGSAEQRCLMMKERKHPVTQVAWLMMCPFATCFSEKKRLLKYWKNWSKQSRITRCFPIDRHETTWILKVFNSIRFHVFFIKHISDGVNARIQQIRKIVVYKVRVSFP